MGINTVLPNYHEWRMSSKNLSTIKFKYAKIRTQTSPGHTRFVLSATALLGEVPFRRNLCTKWGITSTIKSTIKLHQTCGLNAVITILYQQVPDAGHAVIFIPNHHEHYSKPQELQDTGMTAHVQYKTLQVSNHRGSNTESNCELLLRIALGGQLGKTTKLVTVPSEK